MKHKNILCAVILFEHEKSFKKIKKKKIIISEQIHLSNHILFGLGL